MLDLLWLPVSFCAVLVLYKYLAWRSTRNAKHTSQDSPSHISSANFFASNRIIGITSTNNSYDPLGDVLSELDSTHVQDILGEPLQANMEGYMK